MNALFEKWIDVSKRLTLLYVEDNADAREGSMLIFEELFGEVIIAVDGQDGLNKLKEHAVDIIITDINMPRLNGLEMAACVRKSNPSIPILILSAYNESEYFMESIRQSIEGYLLKPINMNQLLDVLGKVVGNIQLREEKEKLQSLLIQYVDITDKSAIVSKTDTQGFITYVNDAFCDVSGYERDEVIGKKHNIIRHEETTVELYKDLWTTIGSGQLWQGIIKNRSKTGKSFYAKTAIKPITNKSGEIVEYIALCNDITAIMNPKKQLFDYIDSVDETVIVLFKIEDYATLEEFYSNHIIELLEKTLGERLLSWFKKMCSFQKIYVLGSGEYAFAINAKKHAVDTTILNQKIKRLLEEIEEFSIHLHDIEYSVSLIGSVAYGGIQPFESAQFGIKRAEKEKLSFIVATDFVVEMQANAQRNMEIIMAVKKALHSSGIVSYFQPIVDNKTKKIIKFESLVRLIDEESTVWAPHKFLDIAKKGSYYTQITQRVLENSFNALSKTSASISINLSALDIEDQSTRTKLIALLDDHKDQAHRLTFELLEDENIKEFEVIKQFIQEVKSRGVSIAIDDFGSGYSNFERLLDYEPDIIKIDGSLIKNIATDDYSISIVKTIVAFANEHKIKTIAEFVENRTIFNILYGLGVDYSQGYYFGRPEPMAYYHEETLLSSL